MMEHIEELQPLELRGDAFQRGLAQASAMGSDAARVAAATVASRAGGPPGRCLRRQGALPIWRRSGASWKNTTPNRSRKSPVSLRASL
ncbi:MAG: hypothetical protein HPM95_07340 [Alphaproteobacteria bacterium]|nr:hypothetical protein [Alphaproteobacteria bacterium]